MTFGGALTLEKNGYLAAAQLSMVEVQKNHLSDSDRCCCEEVGEEGAGGGFAHEVLESQWLPGV